MNPIVTLSEEIKLPRYSVYHYLDTDSDIHFPGKDFSYIQAVPETKKVPIYNVSDLLVKEDVTTLQNKLVNTEIRKWQQLNIKRFKAVDIFTSPVKDVNLISIVNYNLLKDLYRIKPSPLFRYYTHLNLFSTYWSYVKKAINSDKESVQVVTVNVPTAIPSFNIINLILNFNPMKFSRVVSDKDLIQVLDIYRWLSKKLRPSGVMKDIEDKDTESIVIEFKFRGYSSFLPLDILVRLSDSSELESKTKFEEKKVQRIFILMLYKLQNKVNAILEEDVPFEHEEAEVNTSVNSDTEEVFTPKIEAVVKVPVKQSSFITHKENLKHIEKNELIEDLDMTFTIPDSVEEETDNEVDDMYKESILKAEEDKEEQEFTVDYSVENLNKILQPKTLDTQIQRTIEEASLFKTMTSAEIRKLKKLQEERKTLKSPYDEKSLLNEASIVTEQEQSLSKEEVQLTFTNNLVENNLKKEVLQNFDQKYVQTVMKKDVLACIKNLEKSGIIIKEYEIERVNQVTGNYDIHRLTLKPLHGKESTIYFRLPHIDKEGEMLVSGVRVMMRKQRTDLVIRKIAPTKVALTTNYGKLFVQRTERKAYNAYSYLTDYIRKSYLDEEGFVEKVIPGIKQLNKEHLPYSLHVLVSEFNEIITKDFTLKLKEYDNPTYIKPEVHKAIRDKNLYPIGHLSNSHILVIDRNSDILDYSDNMKNLGSVFDLFKIDRERVPKTFSTIKILGDDIPLGVVLSYYLGIKNLLAITQTQFKLLEANKRYTPERNEQVLTFDDKKLVLTLDTPEKELLFHGFSFYKDILKEHNLEEFDYKEIYLNVFETRNTGLIHIKEINLLETIFLDPISVNVLEDMKEPTEYIPLLLRANELLTTYHHPDVNDPTYSRIRGYDRVPGLMYRAISESVRDFKIKNRANSKIELDPYKVWNYVTQDNTVKITEDSNPVLDIKETETITLTGMDGLDKDATPKFLRRFHENDIGLISEGTVDSSEVALNVFSTTDPKLRNLRGQIHVDEKEIDASPEKAFSTSSLLAPLIELDDPKRINFVQIQNAHSIAAAGYHQPLLRTGYEYVIPYRVGKLYCSMAKEEGVVIEVTDKRIIVEYKSKVKEAFPLGKLYGRMEGSIYPHVLVTNLKPKQKFSKDDYICYNKNFFEPDWLNEKRLVLKFSGLVSTALTANDEVFEDSSAISKDFSLRMSTKVIKEKSYIIDFHKQITGILPVGTPVKPTTTLFTVLETDEELSNMSESTIEMLQQLVNLSPKAKYNGTIDRYEIKYNGELQDMSSSLRKLTQQLNKQTIDETVYTEYEVSNNKVTSEYRSNGKNLDVDTLELKVYIEVELEQGIGDKGVFANQMKSVNSAIFSSNITTESGTPIDAMTSYKGIINRIVNSPVLIGTTNRLLKHVSKQVADIYFS